MATHLVELKKIRIDAGTQSRVEIDEQAVSDYHDVLEDGEDLPPITTFYDGIYYYVADGFHRYHAHKRSGRDMIECHVESGTVRDAVLFSLSANATHGLRRTTADKRKAVLTCLNDPEWSELSNREIAKLCKVSHTFVNKVRDELEKPQAKPKQKVETFPDDLGKTPIESPKEVETFPQDHKDEAVAELLKENERLQDRLAVEAMDASEEEKAMAQETIDALRAEVKSLQIELEAVKRSRDQYQMEANEMKKQIKMLQRQLKK